LARREEAGLSWSSGVELGRWGVGLRLKVGRVRGVGPKEKGKEEGFFLFDLYVFKEFER
jgi:hypothetical protein